MKLNIKLTLFTLIWLMLTTLAAWSVAEWVPGVSEGAREALSLFVSFAGILIWMPFVTPREKLLSPKSDIGLNILAGLWIVAASTVLFFALYALLPSYDAELLAVLCTVIVGVAWLLFQSVYKVKK